MELGFKCILFATDFSPASEQPFHYAAGLARRFGARLRLLHVLEDAIAVGTELYLPEPPDLRERRLSDARLVLERLMASTVDLDVACEVRSGSPKREIVNAAGDWGCDLIVLGTHGRGAVTHFLMGSVAESVVRTAPCPVLTVRAGIAQTMAEPVAAAATLPAAADREPLHT